MRGRHAGGSVLLGLGLVLAALSCDDEGDRTAIDPLTRGDDPSAGAPCVPGQTRACDGACPGGASGYQVCSDGGSSYGGCVCSPGTLITSDRFDIDRAALGNHRLVPIEAFDDDLPLNTPGRPLQGSANIGAACAVDDDCVRGLICFDVTDGLAIGGPAGGYCTRPCAATAECEQLEAASLCGTLGGQPLCIRLCEAGPLGADEVKCLGREDLTCTSLTALGSQPPSDRPDLGICTPRCQSDQSCDGLRCDRASGFCSAFPATERFPIGAPCTAGAQCQGGICFAASPEVERVCTAFCTLGAPGCGFDGDESTIEAGCVLPQIPGETSGDRGLCLELCDTAADCQQAEATCVAQPQDGRAGVCVKQIGAGEPPPDPPVPSDAENIGMPCQNDADCAGNLRCLTAQSDPFGVGGGPAGGYCSMPCDGPDQCPGDGVCATLTASGGALCLRGGCIEGAPNSCGRTQVECVDIGVPVCLPACTSDEGCGDRVCNGGLCSEAPVAECSTDTDCEDGEVCDVPNGSCEPAPEPTCSADSECEADEICDVPSGECVAAPPPPCTSDAQCATGEACDVQSGECVALPPTECTADADCATGLLCDLIIGECFVPEPEPCLSDSECPGQVCNPSSGECIAAPAIPIGGACSDDLDCAAEVCPTLGGSSFCSGVCALGTPVGCEPYGSEAFCLLPLPNNPGIGLCLGLCNTSADCAQPSYDCVPLNGTLNGKTGACLPPPPPAPAPAP
jgi:Cys-rich repeat protein